MKNNDGSKRPNYERTVISKEGATIRVTKTPLTGDLKRALTTSSKTFGKSNMTKRGG
jgi:hypothetical protein